MSKAIQICRILDLSLRKCVPRSLLIAYEMPKPAAFPSLGAVVARKQISGFMGLTRDHSAGKVLTKHGRDRLVLDAPIWIHTGVGINWQVFDGCTERSLKQKTVELRWSGISDRVFSKKP